MNSLYQYTGIQATYTLRAVEDLIPNIQMRDKTIMELLLTLPLTIIATVIANLLTRSIIEYLERKGKRDKS